MITASKSRSSLLVTNPSLGLPSPPPGRPCNPVSGPVSRRGHRSRTSRSSRGNRAAAGRRRRSVCRDTSARRPERHYVHGSMRGSGSHSLLPRTRATGLAATPVGRHLGARFMKGLSDRRAAAAVRVRIDGKCVLGQELTGPGPLAIACPVSSGNAVPPTGARGVCWMGRRSGSTRNENRLALTAGDDRRALRLRLSTLWPPPRCRNGKRVATARLRFDRYGLRIEDCPLPRGEQASTRHAERTRDDCPDAPS